MLELFVAQERCLPTRYTVQATEYKKRESPIYPLFTFFIDFLKAITRIKNESSFNYSCSDGENPFVNNPRNFSNTVVAARKTKTLSSHNNVSIVNTDLHRCSLHNSNHTLNECKAFRSKLMAERKRFITTHGLIISLMTQETLFNSF